MISSVTIAGKKTGLNFDTENHDYSWYSAAKMLRRCITHKRDARTNDIHEHDWNMKAVTEDINWVRFFTLNLWKQVTWTLSKHIVPQKKRKKKKVIQFGTTWRFENNGITVVFGELSQKMWVLHTRVRELWELNCNWIYSHCDLRKCFFQCTLFFIHKKKCAIYFIHSMWKMCLNYGGGKRFKIKL